MRDWGETVPSVPDSLTQSRAGRKGLWGTIPTTAYEMRFGIVPRKTPYGRYISFPRIRSFGALYFLHWPQTVRKSDPAMCGWSLLAVSFRRLRCRLPFSRSQPSAFLLPHSTNHAPASMVVILWKLLRFLESVKSLNSRNLLLPDESHDGEAIVSKRGATGGSA